MFLNPLFHFPIFFYYLHFISISFHIHRNPSLIFPRSVHNFYPFFFYISLSTRPSDLLSKTFPSLFPKISSSLTFQKCFHPFLFSESLNLCFPKLLSLWKSLQPYFFPEALQKSLHHSLKKIERNKKSTSLSLAFSKVHKIR